MNKMRLELANRAIEMTGKVDARLHLEVDNTGPIKSPGKVRALILLPEEEDISESEWLQAASKNPSFSFLADPEEDIYSINDGKLFNDIKGKTMRVTREQLALVEAVEL